MKEKEIHLTSEEIDYLLKGTIHWEDIAKREDAPFRKPMDSAANMRPGTRGFIANPSPENKEESITRKNIVEKKIPPRDLDYKRNYNQEYNPDDSLEDCLDNFDENQPFWSGAKVYIVLSLMGCITLGTWAYFVFAS